ncbi:MAG TPA: SgcJ/EcaC family oxidoreductase [Puia sp.]|jgi:uncharacterized protein (TIGR02246 family)
MKNILAFLLFFSVVCPAMSQTVQMVQDAQNIQALLDSMSRSWNRHDARAFSMEFSEDADFTNTLGMTVYGRDSIAKFQEKSFATVFKNSTLNITGKKIRYITNDLTGVDATWEMAGAQTPDGKEISPRKGLMNMLMVRYSNRWLILIMHNMNIPDS